MGEESIAELREKIKQAREWARNHFNADNASECRLLDENLNFLPPAFFVEFPEPDEMIVTPSAMGQSLGVQVKYRLSFRRDGSMAWNGKHPLYNTPLPPLVINPTPNKPLEPTRQSRF